VGENAYAKEGRPPYRTIKGKENADKDAPIGEKKKKKVLPSAPPE